MKKYFEKIKRNFLIIKNDWKRDIKEYSINLALIRCVGTIFKILRLDTIATILLNKKNKIVLSYLEKKYNYIFLKYKNKKNLFERDENIDNLPIWVCWLDGMDNAPPLIQRCIKSIYEHANNHSVNLITWDNISNYIELPLYIKEKVLKKEMSYAHYSDIIRIFLLEKYGGIWLDATIFCAKDLPEEYFKYPFFSCKSDLPTPGCISNNRWTTFCIGGQKGNILFKVLKEFYIEYWKKERYAIDYLFFDDAIELANRILPEVKMNINQIPQNNIKRDELILRFADIWKYGAVKDLLESDTAIFKLGYREDKFLHKYNNENKLTVYGAFIEELF